MQGFACYFIDWKLFVLNISPLVDHDVDFQSARTSICVSFVFRSSPVIPYIPACGWENSSWVWEVFGLRFPFFVCVGEFGVCCVLIAVVILISAILVYPSLSSHPLRVRLSSGSFCFLYSFLYSLTLLFLVGYVQSAFCIPTGYFLKLHFLRLLFALISSCPDICIFHSYQLRCVDYYLRTSC